MSSMVPDGLEEFSDEYQFNKLPSIVNHLLFHCGKWSLIFRFIFHKYPYSNTANHDTIGMIALDKHGNLAGACSTSGMAFKLPGRVGDSPIIGAGLYVDNEVGAATATGHGEEVIRIAGSHLVVELMRLGMHPQQACEEAVNRIIKISKLRNKNIHDIQIGFLAIDKLGRSGAFCIHKEFEYVLRNNSQTETIKCRSAIP